MTASTMLFRPALRSASVLSHAAIFPASQPVAGPSRLSKAFNALPRCSCGEALEDISHGRSRRWISSSTRWNIQQSCRASQASAISSETTSSSSSSIQPPPLPLSSYSSSNNRVTSTSTSTGIDKNIPPPAIVESEPPAKPTQKSRPARREIKAQKAAITLTPTAVGQLAELLDSPTPKLIRIGVRNKGCAGMAYHLEYVEKPGKFDEVIEQDGVKVLIDSKALFSIVGSEMDWQEDKISSKFVFKNPNIKEQCGCGESFLT